MPDRVAFFLPNLEAGGAERVCVNLANDFVSRGLIVDMTLGRSTGILKKRLAPGIEIVDLNAARTTLAVFPLSRYLRKAKPYALVAAPDHANLVAVWANMLAGSLSRVVATNHSQMSMVIKNTGKLQERMYPHLLRLFERWMYALVSVSKGAADDSLRITRLPRNKVHVIYNPVVTEDVKKLAEQPVPHPWFEAGQPPVILAAGRFEPPKDNLTLLDAFALLVKKRSASLIILGSGSMFGEVQTRAKALNLQDKVDLPGFVSNPFGYMSRSAAFVLSSRWEGFSNVLVEALACGTQVVSTDCPSGPSEILENGKYGRLVPVGDAARMAEALEAAIDFPIASSLLINRAQAFSVQSASSRYLELLGLS